MFTVGHGLSEGERMQISDFNTYCKDVVQHVSMIKDQHQNIPFFIIGYSMVGRLYTLYIIIIISIIYLLKLF